ncbi:class I SAM-dependent methyltransferase [Pedobacter deserti]|uniref:class I SAM-dependent methyltransferase n=1 Tax=Pedobacter deserti TaxID=2817382 RepID=UPI00210D2EF9|nr:class I SAM-dependent methyltransferase [Pedobacter sp. SYSU D00382]
MKDNFSLGSDKYAKYRPTYPPELFDYLGSKASQRKSAWDCGAGNGQIAIQLSAMFNTVYATDISQSQIDNAQRSENIIYSLQPAEKTMFQNNMFDLIIVGQAIHWFDFEQFYSEVQRTATRNAWICVVGYGRLEISKLIDQIIDDFYHHVLGHYWDKERKFIDDNYQTIPFPFEEVETPEFVNIQVWTLEHLIGYLNTWSAVKHYIKANHVNPVDRLQMDIKKHWKTGETKTIRFPLLLRLGKVNK